MTELWRAGAILVVLGTVFLGAAAPGARSKESARPAPQVAKACRRADFRIVLDVGHTAEVPGAISARGVPEYVFNLRLADDIQQALVAAGFEKAVLLITGAAPVAGLFQRASRANALRADLFISIHHDSVPDYLLQTWQYEGHENHYNDSFPGYAIFVSNDNGDRAGSLMFGKALGGQLQARGLAYTPHYVLPLMRNRRRELLDPSAGVYRYDRLVVLKETRMPAVLLEAGSIVNRDEELELAGSERRARIGAAVTSAVEAFCAARPGRHRERLTNHANAPATRSR